MRSLPSLVLTSLVLGAPQALAEEAPLGSDRIVLPLAGLEVELPGEADRPGYQVAGMWDLEEDGFQSLDSVDELRKGKLASRTWITIAEMATDSCLEELAALPLQGGWAAIEVDVWGARVAARGGMWSAGEELGQRPAIALCALRGERRRLLMIRAFADVPRLTKPQAIERARTSPLLEQTWRSFAAARTRPIQPAWSAAVEGSGLAASRPIKLPQSGLAFTIPDDGFVWQLAPGAIDTLVRRAPADPELSVDLMIRPHEGCVQSFYELGASGAQQSSAKSLPAGWLVGGRALVAGSQAIVACRLVRGGTLTFAVHRTPDITDWKELGPLMEAVGRAAGHDLMPGTRVEVEWRGTWFAARIRDARGGSYYVDFDDKDEGWNQWVPRERVRRR